MSGTSEIEKAMAEALESVERRQQQQGEEQESQLGEPEIIEIQVEPAEDTTQTADQEEAPSDEETTDAATQELQSVKEQMMRLAADFDNFRKRARRDQEEARRMATERLLKDILPVVDNLGRALGHADSQENPIVAGVQMVAKQFVDILEGYGVKTITSINEPFNPELHEAMSQIPSADVDPGTILEEFERGYMLNDRLLRPAKVLVASAPPEPAPSEATDEDPSDLS